MADLYKDGEYIEVTLTKNTKVGDIVPLKNMCGVAQQNGVAGDEIVVAITKTYFEVAKVDDVIEVGDKLFWDGTQAVLDTTDNTYLGLALRPKADGESEVLFKLNG